MSIHYIDYKDESGKITRKYYIVKSLDPNSVHYIDYKDESDKITRKYYIDQSDKQCAIVLCGIFFGLMFVFCNMIRCRKRMVLDKEELEKKMNEMGLCEQEKNELSDLLCMETLNEEGEKQEEGEKNTNTAAAALVPSLEKVLDTLKRSLKSRKIDEDRVRPYCEEEHYARDTVKFILFCEYYMDK